MAHSSGWLPRPVHSDSPSRVDVGSLMFLHSRFNVSVRCSQRASGRHAMALFAFCWLHSRCLQLSVCITACSQTYFRWPRAVTERYSLCPARQFLAQKITVRRKGMCAFLSIAIYLDWFLASFCILLNREWVAVVQYDAHHGVSCACRQSALSQYAKQSLSISERGVQLHVGLCLHLRGR